MFRDGRSQWELVPNNFRGVAVNTLRVRGHPGYTAGKQNQSII